MSHNCFRLASERCAFVRGISSRIQVSFYDDVKAVANVRDDTRV